jgi:transposase
MVDNIFDHARVVRMDIRTEAGRRRRWTGEEKGRIVAESFEAGSNISEVARRHGLSPQHLFQWRKAARAGRLALQVDDDTAVFAPVVIAPAPELGGRTRGPRQRGAPPPNAFGELVGN